MYVRLFVRMEQFGSHWMDFDDFFVFQKSADNV